MEGAVAGCASTAAALSARAASWGQSSSGFELWSAVHACGVRGYRFSTRGRLRLMLLQWPCEASETVAR
eukprot:2104308-Rhodomonas_salina.1